MTPLKVFSIMAIIIGGMGWLYWIWESIEEIKKRHYTVGILEIFMKVIFLLFAIYLLCEINGVKVF